MHIPSVPESITSERLLIRCPRVDDVLPLYQAVIESLPELKPWMRWATDDYSLEGCETSTREAIANFVTRSNLRYHFFDRNSGELLGSSGLHRINWQVPRFEIGYWIRTSRVGQGLVSEATRTLSKLAFEGLDARRLEIRCDDLNERSAAVAERCGFNHEVTLRNWQRGVDGSLRHERVYVRFDAEGLT